MFKKSMIAALAVVSSLCVFGAVHNNVDNGLADNVVAQGTATNIAFSETKLNVSKAGDKMLIVTAINNGEHLGGVSELGYKITNYTVKEGDFAEKDRYYSSMSVGTAPQKTAKDMGFTGADENSKLLIWEIGYDVATNYEITAYAKTLSGEVNGTLKTNKVSVTFKNGDAVVKSVDVNYGAKVAELPAVPDKPGFENGKWVVGENDFTTSTAVKGNVNVTASYTKLPAPVPGMVENLKFEKNVLTWTEIPGTNYNIQVLRNGAEVAKQNNFEYNAWTVPDSDAFGKYEFRVTVVNEDGVSGETAVLNYTNSGNLKYNGEDDGSSIYYTIAKFDHADWAKQVTFETAGSATADAEGLHLNTTAAKWGICNIQLPWAYNVENLGDYTIEFRFRTEGGTDPSNQAAATIHMHNEKNENSYAYALRYEKWSGTNPTYYGGVAYVNQQDLWINEKDVATMDVGVRASKYIDNPDTEWTDYKAKAITSIGIDWLTRTGNMTLTEIRLVKEVKLDIISGVKDDNLGGTVVVDFDKNANVNYNEYSIEKGILTCKMDINYGVFYNYNLSAPVALTETSTIELRVKNCAYIRLYDSNGANILSEGQIKYHGYRDGGCEYTETEADAEGFKVLTIDASHIIKKTNIAKVEIGCAEAGEKTIIDYIIVK